MPRRARLRGFFLPSFTRQRASRNVLRREEVTASTPIDAALLEMLAACEQLGEGYACALTVIERLARAGLEGVTVRAEVLREYQEQPRRASADLARFRQRIAEFKAQIGTH